MGGNIKGIKTLTWRAFSEVNFIMVKVKMIRRKLSDVLDEIDKGKQQNFWEARLQELLQLSKERKYTTLERRIQDLLESNRVKGIKTVKSSERRGSEE